MDDISNLLIKFYKENDEVLEDIVKISQNREVGYMLKNGSFGHRPSKIDTKEDIINYIKKGALSFHVSIERWIDLNVLKETKSKKELNEYRMGWDFIIDIDAKDIFLSIIVARNIVKYLKDREIEKFYIKYSGGKGFHIAIPWEIFPMYSKIRKKDEIVEEETRKTFPDLARILAYYIYKEVENNIIKDIEYYFSEKEIKERYGVEGYNLRELIEIDTIAISTRHLIRNIYSINEKTISYDEKSRKISVSLSIPIKDKEIFGKDIESISEKLKSMSKLDNFVYENIPFLTEELDYKESSSLKSLIEDAVTWEYSNYLNLDLNLLELPKKENKEAEKAIREIKKSKIDITEDLFPPCIKAILNGEIEDGRKRSLFILLAFLTNIGWSMDKIEKYVTEWNNKLNEPLRERYLEYQTEWFKKNIKAGKSYLTPNCNNEIYYKDMGVCKPDEICKIIKNPLSYPIKKQKSKESK